MEADSCLTWDLLDSIVLIFLGALEAVHSEA